MTPRGNNSRETASMTGRELDKKTKMVKKHGANFFSAHLLVHGLSGGSDLGRRYPERHTHSEAPLVVA